MLIANRDIFTKQATSISKQARIYALRHAPGLEDIPAQERKRIIQTIAANIRETEKNPFTEESARSLQPYQLHNALPQGFALKIMDLLYPEENWSHFLLDTKNYNRYLLVGTLIQIAEQLQALMQNTKLKLKLYILFRQILEQDPRANLPITVGTADLEQLVFALGYDEAWAEFCELLTPETLFALDADITVEDGIALAMQGDYFYINGGQQRDVSGETFTDLGTMRSAKKIFQHAGDLYAAGGEPAVQKYMAVLVENSPQQLVGPKLFELLSCIFDADPETLALREIIFVGALSVSFEQSFFIERKFPDGAVRLERVAAQDTVLWQAVLAERQHILSFIQYKKTDRLYKKLVRKRIVHEALAGYVCLHPERLKKLLQKDRMFFHGEKLHHLAFLHCDLQAGDFSFSDMRGAMFLDCLFAEDALQKVKADVSVQADFDVWLCILRDQYIFAGKEKMAQDVNALLQVQDCFIDHPERIATLREAINQQLYFGIFSLPLAVELLNLLHPAVRAEEEFWHLLAFLNGKWTKADSQKTYFSQMKRILRHIPEAEQQRHFVQWLSQNIQEEGTRQQLSNVLAAGCAFIERLVEQGVVGFQALLFVQVLYEQIASVNAVATILYQLSVVFAIFRKKQLPTTVLFPWAAQIVTAYREGSEECFIIAKEVFSGFVQKEDLSNVFSFINRASAFCVTRHVPLAKFFSMVMNVYEVSEPAAFDVLAIFDEMAKCKIPLDRDAFDSVAFIYMYALREHLNTSGRKEQLIDILRLYGDGSQKQFGEIFSTMVDRHIKQSFSFRHQALVVWQGSSN